MNGISLYRRITLLLIGISGVVTDDNDDDNGDDKKKTTNPG